VTGLIQGFTELFPVSSLGHAVLVPAWVGGSWKTFTTAKDSPYLSFTVALHLASAIGLIWIFRKRWVQLISAGFKTLRGQKSTDGKVFWLLVIASIPAGILGLALEHTLRTLFAKPLSASIFLFINGFILIGAERLTKKNKNAVIDYSDRVSENEILAQTITPKKAMYVGIAQSLALFAGISRFGVTMSAGLASKFSHRVSADFAFLVATPVILAAAIYKVPELLSAQNHAIRMPALYGGIAALIATIISTKFLVKWFKARTLYPFAIYCLIVGLASIIRFG
jgi:undecaprenyl-diphosphatase